MGNFLEAPLTEKTTDVDEDPNKRMWAGMSCMQGWRAQMEDDHIVMLSLKEAPELSLFGVFDGHGGDHVAHYTAKQVQRHFTTAPSFKPPFTAEVVSSAFTSAIIGLDADLKKQPEHMSGNDQSGSTLTMVAITGSDIVCANTGDSRSVLSRAGQAVDLSNDHKPFLDEEKDRIERAGGHVKFNRVNGDLAVSRALGDFAYKTRDDLPPEAQAVTANPEIKVEARTEADEFVILACDGIWDVMSSQEAVNYVGQLLRCTERPPSEQRAPPSDHQNQQSAPPGPRQWDVGAVAEALLDKCLDKGSRDNMSVVIVVLKEELAAGFGARRRLGAAATAPAGGAAAAATPAAGSGPQE